jgi:hypothetical protein
MICTITTSRRPELFKQTMESFRANLRDFELISEMLIVDDGSTPDELDAMKAVAPQFATWLHCEKPEGHVASMRKIWEHLWKSGEKFAFMAEDDFVIDRCGTPLLGALEILYDDPKVGAVCLGRRDMEQFHFRGFTQTGVLFTMREKVFGKHDYPAYSLNPSVVRVEMLLDVGQYEDVHGFERAYGERVNAKGWKICDLFSGFIRHIGDGQSAYDANGFQR